MLSQLLIIAGEKRENISHIHRSLPCKSDGMPPAQGAMCYRLPLWMELDLEVMVRDSFMGPCEREADGHFMLLPACLFLCSSLSSKQEWIPASRKLLQSFYNSWDRWILKSRKAIHSLKYKVHCHRGHVICSVTSETLQHNTETDEAPKREKIKSNQVG